MGLATVGAAGALVVLHWGVTASGALVDLAVGVAMGVLVTPFLVGWEAASSVRATSSGIEIRSGPFRRELAPWDEVLGYEVTDVHGARCGMFLLSTRWFLPHPMPALTVWFRPRRSTEWYREVVEALEEQRPPRDRAAGLPA